MSTFRWNTMLASLVVFAMLIDIAGSVPCSPTDHVTLGTLNYSLNFNCSLPNVDAAFDCVSRNMTLSTLKSRVEMYFFSDQVVRLGFNNMPFWLAGVCPEVFVTPNFPGLCLRMTANVTESRTTGFLNLNADCPTPRGWICDDGNAPPCPHTTTVATTTPPSTTTTTALYTTTTTTTATTTTTVPTTTAKPEECGNPKTYNMGSNLYHILDHCNKTWVAAGDRCATYNSTPAVIVSRAELDIMSNFVSNSSIGNWPFWVGGFMQTGNCVMVEFDRTLVFSAISLRFVVTLGYKCDQLHPIICKTLQGTTKDNLELHKSSLKQGSMMDYRPSAILLGAVGVAILVMTLVVVVILDLPNIVGDARRAMGVIKQFMSSKTDATAVDIVVPKPWNQTGSASDAEAHSGVAC